MKEVNTDYQQIFNQYASSSLQSPPLPSSTKKYTQESYSARNLPIIYESNPNKNTPTKQTANSRISYSKDEKIASSPNSYHVTNEEHQGLSYANTTSHVVESTSYKASTYNSSNVNVFPQSGNKDITEIPRVQTNKPASRIIIDRNGSNFEAPRQTNIDLSTLGYGSAPINLSTLGYGTTSNQSSSLGSGLPEPSSQTILPKVPVITQPSGSQIYMPQVPVTSLPSGSQIYMPQAPVTSLPSGSQIYRPLSSNPIGMSIPQNDNKVVVGSISHMSTETVPRVNYERCVTECKNWETKYNQLYLKYMNIATSTNSHSNDELDALREQNYHLKNNLRQLEDKKNKMISLLESRFSEMVNSQRDATLKECTLLMQRYKLQSQAQNRY